MALSLSRKEAPSSAAAHNARNWFSGATGSACPAGRCQGVTYRPTCAEALRAKLHDLAETLRMEYQVHIPEDGAGRPDPYVTGHFQHGARITAEVADDGRDGPLHALETPDSHGEIRTYMWQEAGLVELRGEPAPP